MVLAHNIDPTSSDTSLHSNNFYYFVFVLQPWERYNTDTSIDLSKHHVPKTFLDKVAYRTVKLLRVPTDIFFQVCYFIWSFLPRF